jgi:NADH-quinone oxidoreductase subunit J
VLFQDIVFWVLAAVAVVAALGVVFLRDIFRGALLLVVAFFAVAGFFVLLDATFLAVVQVLIYVGAISILVIFAIMLTRDVSRGNEPNRRLRAPAFALCGLLLAALVFVALHTPWRLLAGAPVDTAAVEAVFADTPSWLAGLLLKEFVLPFEVASALLLAAVVGALALVRERKP